MRGAVLLLAAVGLALLRDCMVLADPESGNPGLRCKLPSKSDPVVGYSEKYGFKDPEDVKWFNQEWAFRKYGPLSQIIMYKAWYYDGAWHNPGEFKGLQTWYGHGQQQSNLVNDELLIGARRPHVNQTFTLYPDEVLVRAEFQWDHIMRWMNFTSNLGRYFAWGFPAVEGANTAIQEAPFPGAYIAAFRGWEGKPLPPERGGFQKRYISQVGIVWAQRECEGITQYKPKFGKPAKPGSKAVTEASTKAKYAVDPNTQQPVLDSRPESLSRYAVSAPPADTSSAGPAPETPAAAPATPAAPAAPPADTTSTSSSPAVPASSESPAQPSAAPTDSAGSGPAPAGNRRLRLRL